MNALLRMRGRVFAAEQNAIWGKNDGKQTTWRQGPEDVFVFLLLAWLVYWAHPGTWRRIPDSVRCFVKVALWWPVARLVTQNPRYPSRRAK